MSPCPAIAQYRAYRDSAQIHFDRNSQVRPPAMYDESATEGDIERQEGAGKRWTQADDRRVAFTRVGADWNIES